MHVIFYLKPYSLCKKILFIFLLGNNVIALAQTPIPNATVSGCFLEDYNSPTTSEYILPYLVGMSVLMNQGNCGQFITHRPMCTAINTMGQLINCGDRRYSYDFALPIGIPVLAARSGVVTLIVDGFSNSTNRAGEENIISILHGDGTVGSYLHLSPNSFTVSVGDEVQQGEVIALAGSSGFTGFNNPHLHFNVLIPPFDNCTVTDSSGCIAIPVTFRNAQPLDAPLIEGRSYTALPIIASALLPSSRSTQVGQTVTVFASILNSGSSILSDCSIAPITTIPATFSYQATDEMNAPIGVQNMPIDIPAGTTQNFIVSFTPTIPFETTEVALNYSCINAGSAINVIGLNSLLLSAEAMAVPDIVALTSVVDLQATIDERVSTLFAVASANVGETDQITIRVDDGGKGLPLFFNTCQTDNTGACSSFINFETTINYTAGTTASFAIFVLARGPIENDPANNRIFIRFTDSSGIVRGATSTAVRTQ